MLDLRAGLDENVLDFLPYTNSGILVFTPQHPAATLAASEIVKAILFRSLRILFGKGSTFYTLPRMERYFAFINDMLDRVEDVYETTLPNLDAFLVELREALGDHPILHVLSDTLESFRVYYVLNMFNGVEEGYQRAVVPFVENLTRHVSAHLNVTQLGWVVADERIHRANCEGVPAVIERRRREEARPRAAAVDPVMAELERLESAALGLRRRERPPVVRAARPEPPRAPHGPARRPAADAQGDVRRPHQGHRARELRLRRLPRPQPDVGELRQQRVRHHPAGGAGAAARLVHVAPAGVSGGKRAAVRLR